MVIDANMHWLTWAAPQQTVVLCRVNRPELKMAPPVTRVVL